jgi:hypothetical protein
MTYEIVKKFKSMFIDADEKNRNPQPNHIRGNKDLASRGNSEERSDVRSQGKE